MALEEAGVSLKAEGFANYIKRLDEIDKKQRAIFEVVSQKTGKAYDDVARAAKRYEKELKDLANAERKAQQEAEKLAAAQKTAAATQIQASISLASATVNTVKQVATAAFELGKLGAQFQGQQTGLSNLAGSFGQSGQAIQRAIQDASKGTLSGLQAINAANQGLLLGVAKTPEEFANLTNSALTLGRTLGLDATQSIEQFTSALGRQSLLILDNFGISAKQVNAEIERLAQANFGKARSELTEAQKQATFMQAALNVAGEAAATIGDEAGESLASFDRLTASAEDFKTQLGLAVSDLNKTLGLTEFIAKELNTISEGLKFSRGTREGASLDEQIEATEIRIKGLQKTVEEVRRTKGGFFSFLGGGEAGELRAIESGEMKIRELQKVLERLNIEKAAEDAKKFNDNMEDVAATTEDNTAAVKAFESALKQAQGLQLSFAREAEDAARKQARALDDLGRKRGREVEDIERKQAKDVTKLREKQAEDRDKLLRDQAKKLDKFEKDRRKKIEDAEEKIRDARKEAADDRRRDQEKLQRDLLRAQERFNLDQIQSERRFKLQERRLIAEGDILGLQQLREDNELRKQEEKENFEFSQKEQIKSAAEQQKEQAKDLEKRVKDLKSDLDDRRAELLASFDEELQDQKEAQAKAVADQQAAFAEQAAERQIALAREEEDRAIALAREEEDRRISQRRQLEDLGQSLADQKDVTAQGVNSIAEEIERVFGLEGAATNIITGFSSRTRNEFTEMLKDVESTFEKLTKSGEEAARDIPLVSLTGDTRRGGGGGFGERRTAGGIQAFQEGGVVPGPIGAPQPAIVHGGETILPTHQRSFQMPAPVVPSQNLNVTMSGGFNVTGSGQANDEILQAAAVEMTENFRIALQRIARRN